MSHGVRVVLIGGTSNVGKSTVAEVIARRLGFDYVSTDKLGRHPGRPWGEVPPHVVEHYRSLTSSQLVDALLEHYQRMWPRIEELARTTAGLVLEGSGVWPAYVAKLTTPYTTAVWLSAHEDLLAARMHVSSGYDDLPDEDRYLVDKFLARSLAYQTRMLTLVDQLALPHLDVTVPRSPDRLADEILKSPPAQPH